MSVFDWAEHVAEWVEQPCVNCDEELTAKTIALQPQKLAMAEKLGMAVSRPKAVDSYLEELAGPNEQHRLDPNSHCVNPKCDQQFDETMVEPNGSVVCPKCGTEQNVANDAKSHIPDPDGSGKAVLNPGGVTRSGLSLDQMGHIGEQVVLGLGDVPGIGSITPASSAKNFPIDAIIHGQHGDFGVEIKANHSEAQERFKMGGKEERAKKIAYCMANGLKPAFIGVRLNFYTDKAYIFFREGLTDTWISNKQMIHVGTFDFSHLNPYKSPDPQAQAVAVENAHLPDQATGESDDWSDIDAAFGPALSRVSADETFDEEHPRDDEGKFTFKEDVYELKHVDEKGKHIGTSKRCPHCGVMYHRKADHKGRIECPSCGEDPERKLKAVSRILLGAVGENNLARGLGWDFLRHSSNGKPVYKWTDTNGFNHIVTGYGDHGKANIELAHQQTSRRMSACMNGTCNHDVNAPVGTEHVAEPDAPAYTVGQQVETSSGLGIVTGVNGPMLTVKDYQSGRTLQVPMQEAKTAGEEEPDTDPDYAYVFYTSELLIKEWDHNLKTETMLKELLDEFGEDLGNVLMDVPSTKVDTGEIRTRGDEIVIKHTQLSDPDVRESAEKAIKKWWKKHQNEDWVEPSEWQAL